MKVAAKLFHRKTPYGTFKMLEGITSSLAIGHIARSQFFAFFLCRLSFYDLSMMFG
jgi:hypothetical protein